MDKLVDWCDHNNLQLNVDKTKEMIFDFRKKNKIDHIPLSILGKDVEIVHTFKFLGTLLSDDLKWENNVDYIFKKAQQRLYFLPV